MRTVVVPPRAGEGPTAPASSYDLAQKVRAAVMAGVFVWIGLAVVTGVLLLLPGEWEAWLWSVAGSLVGFLVHNRPPARLFMGDAGSYLVGYLLAMATLSATFAGDDVPNHAILAPLCVLAVPLYDTVSVVAIRLRQGRSPFEGDTSHFSHRLVELGLSKKHAVWTIYLATATCGVGALLLHQVDSIGAAMVVIMVGCVLTIIAILETAGRKP